MTFSRLRWLCVLSALGCQTTPKPRPLASVAGPSSQAQSGDVEPRPQVAQPASVEPSHPDSQQELPMPMPRRRVAAFLEEHEPRRLDFTTFHWTLGDGVRAEAGPKPALRKRRPAASMPRSPELDLGDPSVWLPPVIGEAILTRAIDHRDHQVGLYGRPAEGVSIVLVADLHGVVLSFLDFEGYRFSPGTSVDDVPSQDQRLLWAEVRDGVLFVAQAHAAPARGRRNLNAYLGAFEAGTGKLLWRTEGLVVNAENFVFHDGYVLTGYGESSSGKSAIHAVRIADGSVERRVPVGSPPRRFALEGGRLQVQTDKAVFSLEL